MRTFKGKRKAISLHRRQECLKALHNIFQKAYAKAIGTPQERFEIACKSTDDEMLKAAQTEPQKKAFWILVVNDFKEHLLNLVSNEKLETQT